MGATAIVGAAGSELADAVMNGDAAAVRTLLQQKADVNGMQPDGATALHWSVYRDDLQTADLLIAAGANVTIANRAGVTPLALAARYGNAPMIERLLAAGANANEEGPSGETPLMLAARNGNPEAIKVLAAAGADIEAREGLRGTTALMWAAEQRHSEAVKTLVELGADVSARSGPAGLPRNRTVGPINATAVQANRDRRRRAAEAGRTYEEQLKFELDLKRVPDRQSLRNAQAQAGEVVDNDNNNNNRQPVQVDNADQDADAILAGLVGGGSGGLTPLVFAAREGDLESTKILLDAGADINGATEYGWTPLLTAVNNRNYKLATYLVEHGADVNIANMGGWTPLYLATDNRNIEGGDYPVPEPDSDQMEFIELLLDKGADVNAQIEENTLQRTIFTNQWFLEAGATAFVRAAQSSDVELMKLLLAHGADPKLRTDHGDTALTASAGIGWVDGVVFERSPEENVEAVRLLLDLGVDPNAQNNDGRTALMGAAHKGNVEVIQLLVDRGARLDIRDRGSRDTAGAGSALAGRTWQAVDYSDGLVRFGVQSAVAHPEAGKLIRQLMAEQGMEVPPMNRDLFSLCVVELCYPK
jgi:ankyrin repeat protein